MLNVKMKLDPRSVKDAIKEIEKYKKSLRSRCETFVDLLAEHGVAIASANAGKYGRYIAFTKSVTLTSKGAEGYVMAENTQYPVMMWLRKDEVVSAEVNPLLMAEFGSGVKASDASNAPNAEYASKFGAGRGTFPDQTHANEAVWHWKDLSGEWHSSSGEEPSMPMFNAYMEMKDEILNIARQVFG